MSERERERGRGRGRRTGTGLGEEEREGERETLPGPGPAQPAFLLAARHPSSPPPTAPAAAILPTRRKDSFPWRCTQAAKPCHGSDRSSRVGWPCTLSGSRAERFYRACWLGPASSRAPGCAESSLRGGVSCWMHVPRVHGFKFCFKAPSPLGADGTSRERSPSPDWSSLGGCSVGRARPGPLWRQSRSPGDTAANARPPFRGLRGQANKDGCVQ